jgi:hypothetical protein
MNNLYITGKHAHHRGPFSAESDEGPFQPMAGSPENGKLAAWVPVK